MLCGEDRPSSATVCLQKLAQGQRVDVLLVSRTAGFKSVRETTPQFQEAWLTHTSVLVWAQKLTDGWVCFVWRMKEVDLAYFLVEGTFLICISAYCMCAVLLYPSSCVCSESRWCKQATCRSACMAPRGHRSTDPQQVCIH